MNHAVTRATPAGRAYLDLQNLARRNKRPTQEYLQLHVLEGFLSRLATSSHARKFVLKGGVLLAAYQVRRPTADVDFAGRDLSNDLHAMRDLVVDIASRQVDDGIDFDTSRTTADVIRDEEVYSGVRVALRAQIASARLPFHVDINVGDPIWPEPVPVDLPRLIGDSVSLSGYPLPMVIAEKLVTSIQRATANTRWRDYADIYLLTRRHRLFGDEVRTAVEKVVEFRGVRLRRTSDVLSDYAGVGQNRWSQWRKKHNVADLIPQNFADVIAHTTLFADPVIDDAVSGLVWDPNTVEWSARGESRSLV